MKRPSPLASNLLAVTQSLFKKGALTLHFVAGSLLLVPMACDPGPTYPVCPAIEILCDGEVAPIDRDGDGCALECPVIETDCPVYAAPRCEESGQIASTVLDEQGCHEPVCVDGNTATEDSEEGSEPGPSPEPEPEPEPEPGPSPDPGPEPEPEPGYCPRLAVICDDGSPGIDLDGDGCPLECAEDPVEPPVEDECPIYMPPECAEGETLASILDEDGCVEPVCVEDDRPPVCPMLAVICDDGSPGVDLDGDGCPLECAEDPVEPPVEDECPLYMPPECAEDETLATILNEDGCVEPICVEDDRPQVCPRIAVTCEDGSPGVDLDGDGCPLECEGVDPVFDGCPIYNAPLCTDDEVLITVLNEDGCAEPICVPVDTGDSIE